MNEYFHHRIFLLQIRPDGAHAKATPNGTLSSYAVYLRNAHRSAAGSPTAHIRH